MQATAPVLVIVALGACLHAASVRAGHPSLSECLEGSDFIGNAALARDNGIPAQQFIERMQDDFTLIHVFPQELRWFAHDAEDETFLLESARDVFDRPALPEEHRRMFLELCVLRMADTPPEPVTSPDVRAPVW